MKEPPSNLAFPGNDLEIEYAGGIDRRNQDFGDKVGKDETTDLSITEWLPEWPTVHGQRGYPQSPSTVAPTVMNTGRRRVIPASRTDSLKGFRWACIILESKSTMMLADDDPDEACNPQKCNDMFTCEVKCN